MTSRTMPSYHHEWLLCLLLLQLPLIFALPVVTVPEINEGTATDSGDDPFSPLTAPVLHFNRRVIESLQSEPTSEKCKRDTKSLLEASGRREKWANKILDATGKPESGILEGGISFIGFFSECVSSHGSNFSGQYCFTTIQLTPNEKFLEEEFIKSLYRKFDVGLCVPSSCFQDDVDRAVEKAALSLSPMATTTVRECQAKEKESPPDLGAWCVLSLFLLFALLALLGTFSDVFGRRVMCHKNPCPENCCVEASALPSHSTQSITESVTASTEASEILYKKKDALNVDFFSFLRAFSLLSNGRKLLNTESTEGTLDALHGIRFLSMAWIIVGHSFSFAQQWLTFRNPAVMLAAPKDLLSQAFANGTFAVDTFFFLSGFLVAYTLFRELKRNNGRFSLPMFYLHRYLRMTPVMMVVIAFSSTLLRHMGSGPSWKDATMMYDSWCRENWWINALYLQNFIHREHMCLSHTWYSAVDMQLYIISPIIIYCFYRNVYLAAIGLILPLFVTSVLPMLLTLAYHLPAIPNDKVPQSLMNEYYAILYIKPYCRMGPYLVGISLAYILCRTNSNFKLSKKYQILGWVIAITINVTIIYSMWRVFTSEPPTVLEAAFYNGFARTAWGITIAWLTYTCTTGQAEFLNQLLSIRHIVPLSRLTYSAYLIHPVLMALFYGSQEAVFSFSFYWLSYIIIGNLVITYAVSFVLSLLFESPIVCIEKIIRNR